jgi:hypothetical protein
MFLGSYHFEGDPDELLAGYWRMREIIPADELDLHVCARTPRGVIVFDTCPDEATLRAFGTSESFRQATAAAGLPTPRIEPLGEVVSTIVSPIVAASSAAEVGR